MIINNLNVKYFEKILNEKLKNGYVQKVQALDLEEYFLKIKINTKEKNETLCVGNGFLVITKYNPEVRKINKGFSLKSNQILKNKRILEIRQKNLEKIIELEFFDNFLIFEMFSHNNIILTDKNYKIIDCLYKERWKNRDLIPGKQYKMPETNFKSPLKYEFNEKDFNLNNNLVSEIIKKINVPPSIVEIILKNLKVDKEKYTLKDVKKTINEIEKIYSKEIDLANTFVLEKNNKKEYFNVEIENLKKINKSFNEIIDEEYFKKIIEEKVKSQEILKNKEKQKIEYILKSQEKKIKEFEKKSKINKIKGDLIYENYDKLEEILNYIKKALNNGKKLEDIEKIINENKQKYELLKLIKKIDKKNKKIIFTLHLQQ